jgi:predicted MFS family arabinose efflux permease
VRNPYADLLRVPGGPAFSAAAFVARLPMSMVGIGLVLLVSSAGGRYALAGAVAACYALAGAVLAPQVSRQVDRRGQRAVVPAATALSLTGLGVLVLAAQSQWPAWTLFPAAVLAGGLLPNVGSLVRARWSGLLAGTPQLRTAYSLESVLDEVVFILGPPAITVLAAQLGPGAALLGVQVFVVVGTVLFVAQRRTEPRPVPAGHGAGPSVIALPGLRALVLLMVALGGVFGSIEVVTVAFADERDRPVVAGVLLALYAAGSLVGGVGYGARQHRTPLHRQLVVLGLLTPLGTTALPFADRAVVLGALVTFSGLVVAPTLIATFALVDHIVPGERLTEGLTWATTGITLGVSLGAAAVGPVIDAVGTPAAYLVTAVSGVLTAAVAVAAARWLHPARATG